MMDPNMMSQMWDWFESWTQNGNAGNSWSQSHSNGYKGGKGKGKGKGYKGKHKGKTKTPEQIEEYKKKQEEFEAKLLAGIVAGLRRAGGKLQLAQIGALPEVKACRTEYEAEMKALQLHTWITKNDMTFKMEADPKTPQSTAANIVQLLNLNDGAHLIDAELPPTIDRTTSLAEKWMALRKLIIRVLERNGGKCQMTLIGQEYAINQLRKNLWGASKLQDFVRKFHKNFQLDATVTPAEIILLSPDEAHLPQGGWPDEAAIAARNKELKERYGKPKAEKRLFSQTGMGGSSSSKAIVPANTPVDRTVRLSQAGMQQASIAQASGNLTGAQYILQLVQLLQDPSPQVSDAAVEQLRQLGIQ